MSLLTFVDPSNLTLFASLAVTAAVAGAVLKFLGWFEEDVDA